MPPEIVNLAGDSATLGRAPECEVRIDDPEVSRRHTRLLQGVIVVDLGSRNGTWIEQQRIGEATRLPGTRFSIGQGERAIHVELEPAEAAAVPADEFADVTITAGALRSAPSPAAAAATPPPPAAPPAAPASGAAAADLAAVRSELERERKRAFEACRELEELKRARDAKQATSGSELAEARLEIMRLQQRLGSLKAELDSSAKAGADALATRLLQEKYDAMEQRATLHERRVRELEAQVASAALAAPPAAPAPAPGVPMSEFVARMQRELMRLQTENAQLKARGGALPPSAPPIAPAPSAPAAAPFAASAARRIDLAPLAGKEIDRVEAPADAELHDFLLVATVRFLRGAEKVVAYSAREFVELLDMQTVLPDHERNFAQRLQELLAQPRDAARRADLDRYLRELSRWMVASLAAYKTAAREFALGVKRSLSPEALSGGGSGSFSLFGSGEAKLWQKAAQWLAELSPDTIDDRVEKLAREAAQKILAGGAASSGGTPPPPAAKPS